MVLIPPRIGIFLKKQVYEGLRPVAQAIGNAFDFPRNKMRQNIRKRNAKKEQKAIQYSQARIARINLKLTNLNLDHETIDRLGYRIIYFQDATLNFDILSFLLIQLPVLGVFLIIYIFLLISLVGLAWLIIGNFRNELLLAIILIIFLVILLIKLLNYMFNLSKVLLDNLIVRWKKSRYTLPFIVENLTYILFDYGRQDEYMDKKYIRRLMDMTYKRRLILKLEDTAKCIESYLPRWFHTGDVATDIWIEERFKQIAAALREKEKWLLTPKEDTYDYFITSIASTLLYFVEDNWDALELREPEKLTRPPLRTSIVTFILNALKPILIAVLPVVGFIIFQHTSLALTGAAFVSVVSILSIYEVTVVTSVLNPNTNVETFKDTISRFKDISS